VDISVLAQDPPTAPPSASNRDTPRRPSDSTAGILRWMPPMPGTAPLGKLNVISYHFTELLLEITVLGMLSLPKEFLRFVAIFAILFSKGKKTGSLWKKHR
jgi:hypothetical protein